MLLKGGLAGSKIDHPRRGLRGLLIVDEAGNLECKSLRPFREIGGELRNIGRQHNFG